MPACTVDDRTWHRVLCQTSTRGPPTAEPEIAAKQLAELYQGLGELGRRL